jgi:quinol monooxygenase YgiN
MNPHRAPHSQRRVLTRSGIAGMLAGLKSRWGGRIMRIRVLGLALSLLLGVFAANAQAPGAGGSSSSRAAGPRIARGFGNATAFVVQFKVKPGQNAAFEKVFRDAEMKVRDNEPGNLSYDLYRTGPQTYVIVERYRDRQAVEAHGKDVGGPGGLMAQLNDLLDGRPAFQALTHVSSK